MIQNNNNTSLEAHELACIRDDRTLFSELAFSVGPGEALLLKRDLTLAMRHCAGEQGKLWEMRDILFRNPQKLNEENLPAHAETPSLDMTAFNECLQSDRHLAEIDQDAKDARAVRLTDTPSFIIAKNTGEEINGQVVIGAQPMKTFDAAISKALEQKPSTQ